MTPAEARRLAARAKRARFEDLFAQQVAAARLAPPLRQYAFAKALGRRWDADFAWPDLKLLAEVDGGIWRRGGGAHSHPTNILRDMAKQNDAVLLGWRVLRFTTDEVTSGYALALLRRVMDPRETVPRAPTRSPRVRRLTSRGLRARAALVRRDEHG